MKTHWSKKLEALGACFEAVEWSRKQPTEAKAWAACKRPDWLLWIAGRAAKTKEQRFSIALAACDCAERALRFVPENEDRQRECIEATRAFIRGEISIEELRKARPADAAYAAYAAAYAAAADAAAAAAYAAAAADAAYAVAYAAADAAVRAKERVSLCKLIRRRIKRPALP